MIGSDAPIIFAKACEVFVLELTLRSWIHTEENKRRTLQKSDISIAISKSDMFDFLIDIVPRDEFKMTSGAGAASAGAMTVGGYGGIPASLPPPTSKIPDQYGSYDYQQQQQQVVSAILDYTFFI